MFLMCVCKYISLTPLCQPPIYLLLCLLSLSPDVWKIGWTEGLPTSWGKHATSCCQGYRRGGTAGSDNGKKKKTNMKGKEKQMKAGDMPSIPKPPIVWALLWKRPLEHRKGFSKDKEQLSKAGIKQEMTGENNSLAGQVNRYTLCVCF